MKYVILYMNKLMLMKELNMNDEKISAIKELMSDEDVQKMWKKMHTPWHKRYDIRPNDPCPCGSGKKYKDCCKNRLDKEDQYTTIY